MKILLDGKPTDLERDNPTARRIGEMLSGLRFGELLSTDAIIRRTGRGETSARNALKLFRSKQSVRFGKALVWGSEKTIAAVRKEKGLN